MPVSNNARPKKTICFSAGGRGEPVLLANADLGVEQRHRLAALGADRFIEPRRHGELSRTERTDYLALIHGRYGGCPLGEVSD